MALGLEQHGVRADIRQRRHLRGGIHLRERVRAIGSKVVIDEYPLGACICHGVYPPLLV